MSPLEQLVSMGFPEEIARSTLEAHGFDLERSLDALIGQSASTDSRLSEVIQAPISQYDIENGRSACTCICLEASLFILEHLGNGTWAGSPENVGNIVTTGVVMYEAVTAAGTLATEHTSVAEILTAVSRYREVLEPATEKVSHQGLLGSGTSLASILEEIQRERQEKSRPVAVAITKPPETVVAFLPPQTQGRHGDETARSSNPRRWLLFDSHPRPQLGLVGASVQSFEGESELLAALNNIFPAFDLGTDDVMASMYNMVDCTPMTLKSGN